MKNFRFFLFASLALVPASAPAQSVGVWGNVSALGQITTSNTTDSSSTTTGAVIDAGGLGVAESVFVGSGLVIGAPTGGNEGAGTVNATGYYLNGAAIGGGNVSGPGSSTSGYVPTWNNTGGTSLAVGLPVGTTGDSTIVETSGGGYISPLLIQSGSLPGSVIGSGTVSASYLPLGSSSAFGVLECGSGTSCASGVITVSGGSLAVGSTAIAGGTSPYLLYNNGGTLGNESLATLLASPPAIGATTPASGTFSTLTAGPSSAGLIVGPGNLSGSATNQPVIIDQEDSSFQSVASLPTNYGMDWDWATIRRGLVLSDSGATRSGNADQFGNMTLCYSTKDASSQNETDCGVFANFLDNASDQYTQATALDTRCYVVATSSTVNQQGCWGGIDYVIGASGENAHMIGREIDVQLNGSPAESNPYNADSKFGLALGGPGVATAQMYAVTKAYYGYWSSYASFNGQSGYYLWLDNDSGSPLFYVNYNGAVVAEGYTSRAGSSGSTGSNLINNYWTGSCDELYVDTSNEGCVATNGSDPSFAGLTLTGAVSGPGTFSIGSGGGVTAPTLTASGVFQAGPTAGEIIMAGLPSSVGTAYICVNGSSTVSYASSCGTSALRFKNVDWADAISPKSAEAAMVALRVAPYVYKGDPKDRVHVGLFADDVAKMDPRCGIYDAKGEIEGYDNRCVIAYLAIANRYQQREIEELREDRR